MTRVFIRSMVFLFICAIKVRLYALDPSTVITSDRMEMLRFKDHNEFVFEGDVQIKNVNFFGSAGRMWVYMVPWTEREIPLKISFWVYGLTIPVIKKEMFSYILKRSETKDRSSQMGQIRLIIATQSVFLETQDGESGEVKRARANRAEIYPKEAKMVLTEDPVVHCSSQGTFRGGKITFYKSSERVIVENPEGGNRSQVVLSE